MTDLERVAKDIAAKVGEPKDWQLILDYLIDVRDAERDRCAKVCEGLAEKAQFIADSQINWNEAQRPEGAAAGCRECAAAIRRGEVG